MPLSIPALALGGDFFGGKGAGFFFRDAVKNGFSDSLLALLGFGGGGGVVGVLAEAFSSSSSSSPKGLSSGS